MIFRLHLSRSSFVERTGLAGGHLGREDRVNSGELRGVLLAGSQWKPLLKTTELSMPERVCVIVRFFGNCGIPQCIAAVQHKGKNKPWDQDVACISATIKKLYF